MEMNGATNKLLCCCLRAEEAEAEVEAEEEEIRVLDDE